MSLKRLFASVCTCVVVAAFWASYAMAPENSARVRNALLATVGSASDFNWTPQNVPQTYRNETSASPAYWQKVKQTLPTNIDSASSLDQAIAITRLMANTQSERFGLAIQKNTQATYSDMLNYGMGYCADYSQVFNAIAHSLNLPVREWALAFDGFGRGHTFNEVYDPETERWIFIDSFHGFYFADAQGQPLSVAEVQHASRTLSDLNPIIIDRARFAFRSTTEAIEYYRRGADQFYLFWANDVFTQDQHQISSIWSQAPRAVEVFAHIADGSHPRVRLIETPTNAGHIRKLNHTKWMFLGGLIAMFLCGCWVLWELVRLRRKSPA